MRFSRVGGPTRLWEPSRFSRVSSICCGQLRCIYFFRLIVAHPQWATRTVQNVTFVPPDYFLLFFGYVATQLALQFHQESSQMVCSYSCVYIYRYTHICTYMYMYIYRYMLGCNLWGGGGNLSKVKRLVWNCVGTRKWLFSGFSCFLTNAKFFLRAPWGKPLLRHTFWRHSSPPPVASNRGDWNLVWSLREDFFFKNHPAKFFLWTPFVKPLLRGTQRAIPLLHPDICKCIHNRSHLGWHFRMLSKLKVQSSNVSFHWNVAKETFELWALSFRKCHPKWDWLYLFVWE